MRDRSQRATAGLRPAESPERRDHLGAPSTPDAPTAARRRQPLVRLLRIGQSEDMGTPLIAKELQASFREAITDAKSMRHEYLTLEHLLLALTRELKTQKILVVCGAYVTRLRKRLEKFLAEEVERLPESASVEPQQTIGATKHWPQPGFVVPAQLPATVQSPKSPMAEADDSRW
jgi:hypothetical protein